MSYRLVNFYLFTFVYQISTISTHLIPITTTPIHRMATTRITMATTRITMATRDHSCSARPTFPTTTTSTVPRMATTHQGSLATRVSSPWCSTRVRLGWGLPRDRKYFRRGSGRSWRRGRRKRWRRNRKKWRRIWRICRNKN